MSLFDFLDSEECNEFLANYGLCIKHPLLGVWKIRRKGSPWPRPIFAEIGLLDFGDVGIFPRKVNDEELGVIDRLKDLIHRNTGRMVFLPNQN